MEIPGLGVVTKHAKFSYYESQPISVSVLNGTVCQILVEGYDDSPFKDDFHQAIDNFLTIGPSVLAEVEHHIFDFYKDCNAYWETDDESYIDIKSPSDIWKHIQFGSQPIVQQRNRDKKMIYVSIECNCDWEREHGLQIVFENGLRVNKVGQFDGHLTNSDAFDDPSLENVIYKK
jgi:hypothetical protein